MSFNTAASQFLCKIPVQTYLGEWWLGQQYIFQVSMRCVVYTCIQIKTRLQLKYKYALNLFSWPYRTTWLYCRDASNCSRATDMYSCSTITKWPAITNGNLPRALCGHGSLSYLCSYLWVWCHFRTLHETECLVSTISSCLRSPTPLLHGWTFPLFMGV